MSGIGRRALTAALVLAGDLAVARPIGAGQAVAAEAGAALVVEDVVVRGHGKTRVELIRATIGLGPGDVVTAGDRRVEAARLRLLALGAFLDARLSLEKGSARGHAILIVEVEERGTIIVDAIHLGSSAATALWGGLGVSDGNFLGRAWTLGGVAVGSTTPRVAGARPALALALRLSGAPTLGNAWTLGGGVLYAAGNEFFRRGGPADRADPAGFVAARVARSGGAFVVGRTLARGWRVTWEERIELIDATLPAERGEALPGGGTRPIVFGVHEGRSHLFSGTAGLEWDGRDDPILPRRGGKAALQIETSMPGLGADYRFVKATTHASWHVPVGGDAVGIFLFGGAIDGDTPYFNRFFVADLNPLLPQRALGVNFATTPSRDLVGGGMAPHRYDEFAASLRLEYAMPLLRRRGLVYRGEAFAALGTFGMATRDRARYTPYGRGRAGAVDLTADLGLRLDTAIGIFTLSVANGLGRVPL